MLPADSPRCPAATLPIPVYTAVRSVCRESRLSRRQVPYHRHLRVKAKRSIGPVELTIPALRQAQDDNGAEQAAISILIAPGRGSALLRRKDRVSECAQDARKRCEDRASVRTMRADA